MTDRSSFPRAVADGIHAGLRSGRRRPRRPHPDRLTAFSERLAHDVRTPLTVIQEYAALLSEGFAGDLSDEQRRILAVISDRASDLNRVVDNAVDASRLCAKRQRVWGRRCRVSDILAHIRPLLERKAAVRNVELQVDASTDLPDIYCDDELVARAIANIVSGVLNLSAAPGRVTISQDVDWSSKEAGIRVTADGASSDASLELFRELAKPGAKRRRASEIAPFGEMTLAAKLLDCNLGRIEAAPAPAAAGALWIALPIAESVEVLRRHLVRAMLRPDARRVSLFRASIRGGDEEIARDVGHILNSIVGRRDLALELDDTRWLVSIVQRRVGRDGLSRRIDRRRQRINRRRLGRPLPEISIQSYGQWQLPDDLTRLLSTIGRWIDKAAPVEVGAR